MLPLIGIASGIVLGGSLAHGYQSRALRRKRYSRYILGGHSRPPKARHTSFSQSVYQRAVKLKKGVNATRKVFSISMGGVQDRDKHMRQLTPHHDSSQLDRELDRRIKLSLGLIALATTGAIFSTPLLIVAGTGTLINIIPVVKELLNNLKKGRITTELLEVVSQVSFLLTGYYLLATLVSFIALLDMKLLRRTEARSQQQLIDQFSQKSRLIWILVDDSEVEVPLESVRKNDIVIVNAGEAIPVDGTVLEGIATIDQHSLTGESQPVEKEAGEVVFATTVVLSGRLLVRAEHTGRDTNAARIGEILEQTQDYKESLRLRGKKIADAFIAPTLLASGLTLPFMGSSSALAVLWSGFGYDMKLYGPISVLNFLHLMAKNGILIKDGRSLETLQKVDTVVFDKTGTLTDEQPELGHIYPLDVYDEETLLTYAAAAEYRQKHPIAKAILSAAEKQGITIPGIEDAAYEVGFGIQVTLDDKLIQVGSTRFMEHSGIHLPATLSVVQEQAHEIGSSLVYIAVNKRIAGILRMDSCVRPEASHIVEYLQAEGIKVLILSGDNEVPTRRLAQDLGVDGYYAEKLPTQKAELIARLREQGRHVGYIGDGINDSIALKGANVSISLCGSSTVATDTAQVILMDGGLARVESLFEISKAFEKNMKVNFRNSMIPGVITLTGVFTLHMGVVGALLVYFTSEALALTNCMMPLIKDEMAEDDEDDVSWKIKDVREDEPVDMMAEYILKSGTEPAVENPAVPANT